IHSPPEGSVSGRIHARRGVSRRCDHSVWWVGYGPNRRRTRPPTEAAPCREWPSRRHLICWCLDNELSCDFLGLVALCVERLPFRRIVIRLCFFQAFPLRDTKALRRLADQTNDFPPSRDDAGSTAGGPCCGLRLGRVWGKGGSVEHFGFGDDVRSRLSLSVQSLHNRCTERGASE